ncbi:MAG: undecaprenyl-diphosphatase UppP [Patescibacteria group bacterium]|nr:undecaprenyl-diphosphatase UppP [Patescibacteria group bacterium]
MQIIHSIILGIIEGLSEFLPISSTAHLDFTRSLMGLADTDFIKSFEIIIQLGAILAVLVIYLPKIIKHFKSFSLKIAAAFLPTAIIGFILYKIIKHYFLGNTWLMIGALFFGGIAIIYLEKKHAKGIEIDKSADMEKISLKQSFILGCIQSLAMVPGVSRSGATIIGGIAMGIPRSAIVEFSFLLAIPTMIAASGYDIYKNGLSFSNDEIMLIVIGFVVSFIVALAVIKWFLKYIQTNNFIIFGWYRIVAAVTLSIFFFLK